MDFALIILVGLLNYAFLRSKGGKGIAISAQLAPANTAQGKKDRLIGSILLGLTIAAFMNAFIHENSDGNLRGVLLPTLSGMLIFIIFYSFSRSKD